MLCLSSYTIQSVVNYRAAWATFRPTRKIKKIYSKKFFIFLYFFLIFCEMQLSTPKIKKFLILHNPNLKIFP